MPQVLPISQFDRDPILLEVAKKVENVRDPAIQVLIDDMIETCRAANGAGIAAPQVFQPLRLFIISSKPNPSYPEAPDMEPLAIINPIVLSASEEMIMGPESCLSIQGLRSKKVPRHKWMKVTFINRYGEEVMMTLEDFLARVFQHELDHLNGILFPDRTKPEDMEKK